MSEPPETTRHDGLERKLLGFALAILAVCIGLMLFLRWKRGSERAECIMNLRNVQQAVRSMGMYNEAPGDPISWSRVIGPGQFIAVPPVCPAHGTYTFRKIHPPVGTLAAECSHALELKHHPASTAGW